LYNNNLCLADVKKNVTATNFSYVLLLMYRLKDYMIKFSIKDFGDIIFAENDRRSRVNHFSYLFSILFNIFSIFVYPSHLLLIIWTLRSFRHFQDEIHQSVWTV
jgi:hypothetical protein